jgi:hypothetical protein
MNNTFSRVCEINTGRVMVVTDLHGDWELYTRYRDYFMRYAEQDYTLVVAGDYIHSEGPAEYDQSLQIVLDLINLKRTLGSALIVLLGNHEMPHIYHIPLSKGAYIYTPRFESALGQHRSKVIDFFLSLPMWVRTKAGVSICHAGAFAEVNDPSAMDILFHFSHRSLLQNTADNIREEFIPRLRQYISAEMGIPYDEVVRQYLSVEGPDDPRYDDYMLGAVTSQDPDFRLLWSALFSANELVYGRKMYTRYVKTLLSTLSLDYHLQSVLVTGHIGCRGGYELLANNRQLRLASGVHAHPKSKAKVLIFDAAKPISNGRPLVPGLLDLDDLNA